MKRKSPATSPPVPSNANVNSSVCKCHVFVCNLSYIEIHRNVQLRLHPIIQHGQFSNHVCLEIKIQLMSFFIVHMNHPSPFLCYDSEIYHSSYKPTPCIYKSSRAALSISTPILIAVLDSSFLKVVI